MSELRSAYEGSASAWHAGASLLYDQLAETIATHVQITGSVRRVLDAGAGTGAMCRALRRRGVNPVALDASVAMLARVGGAARALIAGDLLALPFGDGSFDAAVSTFAVSHVNDPVRAVSELHRVVSPGGSITVAVFGAAAANVSKDIVDETAVEFGFSRPGWYVDLKTRTEPLTNTPELLRSCAAHAGAHDVHIADISDGPGLERAEDIVAYRTGMAHLAPFVGSLTPERRAEFMRRAVASVARNGQPVRPRVLILSSVVAL